MISQDNNLINLHYEIFAKNCENNYFWGVRIYLHSEI